MRFVRAYSLPDAGVRDWQDLGRSDCEHPQHKPAVHAFSTMMKPTLQALIDGLIVLRSCSMQACGSGGTTAGLALGNHLSGMGATVHAYGVCDDEEYFYDFIDGLYKLLGATPDRIGRLAGLPWVPRTPVKPQLFCRAGRLPEQI